MSSDLLHLLMAISTGSANALLTGIWQGALLTLCVLLCLRFLPNIRAANRFALWASAFGILALLPILHWPHSGQTQLGTGSGPMFQVDVRWSFAIAAVWGISSLLRLARLASNAVRLRTLWRDATPLAFPIEMEETLISTDSRSVHVFTSTQVDRPSVIGFFSPRILIPSWLIEKLSAEELRQIVLHEREHLRRADDWLNLLQKIALAVFPLNPVLLWIEKRLCFERELACDDGVLRATQAPHAYASCLASLADRTLDRRATSLSLGAWERRPALARRVFRILLGEKAVSPKLSRGLTAGLVSALVLGAAGLSRCPELVSFTAVTPPSVALVPPHSSQAIPYGARLQNVSFQEDGNQGTRLTKASLVSYRSGSSDQVAAQRNSRNHSKFSRRSALRGARARQREKLAQRQGDWMVLTSWDKSYSPAVVFAVMTYNPDDTSSTYVSAGAGWIFFQL
ncbi:MAG TPA: M56 family metallopeptidase [Acidisarcina sp.]